MKTKNKKVLERHHIEERDIENISKRMGTKLYEIKIGNSYSYFSLPEKLKLKDGKELEIVVSSIEQDNKKILHSLLNKLDNI